MFLIKYLGLGVMQVTPVREINFESDKKMLSWNHEYKAPTPTSALRSTTAPIIPLPVRLSRISPHSPASSVINSYKFKGLIWALKNYQAILKVSNLGACKIE